MSEQQNQEIRRQQIQEIRRQAAICRREAQSFTLEEESSDEAASLIEREINRLELFELPALREHLENLQANQRVLNSEAQESLILQEQCRSAAGQLYSNALRLKDESETISSQATRKNHEAEAKCFQGFRCRHQLGLHAQASPYMDQAISLSRESLELKNRAELTFKNSMSQKQQSHSLLCHAMARSIYRGECNTQLSELSIQLNESRSEIEEKTALLNAKKSEFERLRERERLCDYYADLKENEADRLDHEANRMESDQNNM